MLNRAKFLVLAATGATFVGSPAFAEDFEVQMLNRGAEGEAMVFEPAFLNVAPGDTVTFVPTDRSHNVETILGMIPEGAEAVKGKINEEVTVTFEEPGVYGYKCLPHYALGMVALIQVGDEPPNLDESLEVRHPGKAGQRMAILFENVGAEDAEDNGDEAATN